MSETQSLQIKNVVVFAEKFVNSIWNPFLNISANWIEMSFLSGFIILVAMLFGPTDLCEFRKRIIFCISYLLVRPRKKEF